ncbi:tyrosine-type recombinase/integrase [Oceanobacillus profundus]|uniref:tyrosine-type recombinase/integrase n=2 Tax=Oceanobacillus TaxID=182709 RepID=UPI0026E12310|nr:tyrosine-type recombinase/integrase [Oceanobacillus profundus]
MKGIIEMKLNKSKKDPEVYYYHNTKKEKLWCFRHRYYDSLGKRREKSKQGFKTENEAYRALLSIRTTILNGDTKQVENSNLTVSEWLDIWYETHQNDWEISTLAHRKRTINLHMKPLLGKYKLATLDKATYIRVFINALLEKLSPSTVQLYHQLFKIAINSAVDSEILPRNRFTKVTIPKKREQTKNFLTAEELSSFLLAAKESESITIYTLLMLLAFTGFRKGEAHGLKWKDVNFKFKTITVERTRDIDGIRTPKTKKSYRTILVDDDLINQLKNYRKWCKEVKLSCGIQYNEDDLVFINKSNATPIFTNSINGRIKKICDALEINEISPHGLRHTHATISIGNKTPVNVIADRLGNTPQMIYNVYGHSFEELEQESVAAFSESLRATGGGFGGGF